MLVGKKVVLEEVNSNSIEQLRVWRNDPSLRKWFREWKDITEDRQLAWYNERGNNTNSKHVYFQIMERNTLMTTENASVAGRKLAGCCGLHYIDWRLGSAEFGIFLGPNYRGRGLGKESLRMLCEFGFNEMNLHKIWCEVFEGNSSIDLYKKLGFKIDGVLRDSWFSDGKYGNSIVMSLLESEFRSEENK